jgi:hypothetical protein
VFFLRKEWRGRVMAFSVLLTMANHHAAADESDTMPAYLQSAQMPEEVPAGQQVFSREFIPYPLYEDREELTPAPTVPTETSVISLQLPGAAAPTTTFDAVLAQKTAQRAWAYFRVSASRSGLFDSVLGYHHSTMWDAGSALAGIAAAERLHLISRNEFLIMMRKVLTAYSTMPLYADALPNREINIESLTLLDIRSRASTTGSGWSALDIGRLLIWLRILHNWYPELRQPIATVMTRWDLTRLMPKDELTGEAVVEGKVLSYQEGRLGYEQYAAAGLALWGKNATRSLHFHDTEEIQQHEITLHRDLRGQAFLTSEPFFLALLELGRISPEFGRQADAVYEIQKRRATSSGEMMAMSEDAIDQRPWFVYNSLNYDGEAWRCVSHSGKPYPQAASLSTKTAFAWWAVYGDDYASRLMTTVKDNYDAEKGYYGGIYTNGERNRSLNINTNAVILEAVLYRALGHRPLIEVPAEAAAGKPVTTTTPSPPTKRRPAAKK